MTPTRLLTPLCRGWVGVEQDSKFWLYRPEYDKQQLVRVGPFDSMLKLVGPDWLGSVSDSVRGSPKAEKVLS